MSGLVKYYEELNLAPGASADEIRKAYRKRVLQCHPDKAVAAGGGDDGEAFHRATEAYRRLSNATQFLQFSKTGDLDANIQAKLSETMRLLFLWLAFAFKNASSPRRDGEHVNVANFANVVDVHCPVTLEDLMNKRIKKITLRVRRGGALVPHTLYVSTLNYQSIYTFEKVGDEGEEDGVRGDVRVHLDILPDPSPLHFHIDDLMSRYDISMTLHVSLLDYYVGRTFEIPYLDGTVLQVPYEPGSHVHVAKGAGLPCVAEDGSEGRGDLLVHFNLVLPPASKVCQDVIFMQRLQELCVLEAGEPKKTQG